MHNPVLVAEMQTMKPGGRDTADEIKARENLALQNAVLGFSKDLDRRAKAKKQANIKLSGKTSRVEAKQSTDDYGLKPQQLQKIYDRFRKIDQDNSGYIDYHEFCLVLEQQDTAMTKRLFEMFDADGSGTLELKEFIVGLCSYTSSSKEERLKFAFMMFDEDGSGFIERNELCKILKANFISQQVSDAEIEKRVDALLNVVGVGPHGKLDFNEFLQVANTSPGIMFPAYALLGKMDEVLPLKLK